MENNFIQSFPSRLIHKHGHKKEVQRYMSFEENKTFSMGNYCYMRQRYRCMDLFCRTLTKQMTRIPFQMPKIQDL